MAVPMRPVPVPFMSHRMKLNYVRWGDPSLPVLVLVHGTRDHARSWDWIARDLCREWQVVCPDLRGHGDSSWSPDGAYSLPLFVADLAELVDQFGTPVSLVGHSLGGAICLRLAGVLPDRVDRLVAIEGLGPMPRPGTHDALVPVSARWRDWMEKRRGLVARTPRRYASIEAATERMRSKNERLSQEQARHLASHGVRRHDDGTFGWKFDHSMQVDQPVRLDQSEVREIWAQIECPVWLVHGAASFASHPGLDGRAACFRSASVTSFAGAGHWVQHDRLPDFALVLRRFLQGESDPPPDV